MLHPNQQRAVTISCANGFASGIHSHATGTGKSWIALELIDRFLATQPAALIIWICEQKSILQDQFAAQTINSKGYAATLKKFIVHDFSSTKPPDWPSRVNQASIWRRPQLVIINRAFLTSQERYKALRTPVHLIVHDECHSVRNRTTQDFYSHVTSIWPSARTIGFSATPCTDYEPLTQILSHYSIADAVADGVILPPTIHWLKSRITITDAHIRAALKVLIADQPYKKVVIWCGLIEQCFEAAAAWAPEFPDYLVAVDTSAGAGDFATYEAFADAPGKALLFCAAKHREGSDIANLDTCVFLDRVADRGAKVFVQCIGRVLRRDPAGLKRTGIILDVNAASSIKVADRMSEYLAAKGHFPFTYKLVHWPPVQLHTLKMEVAPPAPPPPLPAADLRTYFVRTPKPEYAERLNYELSLIVQKDLAKYLLRAVEVLHITAGIPHVTRGSCGSSLVVYLLGISHVDPVKYNISFARFLTEFRDTLPDIDFDFPYNLRDEVFLQLHQRWPGCIARISNHNHYHEKSALRQAARQAGIRGNASTLEVMNQMRRLPAAVQASIKREAAALKDQFRGYSLHCGGIIFYPNGIPDDKRIGQRTIPQVSLDKHEVAAEKHFKIDILSSRALAILYECMNYAPINFEEDVASDEAVAELFASGDNVGIILGESPLIRKAFRHFKPRTIDDLALCLAIIRPAARDAKHAATTADLTATRVYDDDAITLIATALNCSEAAADQWRRGLTKGDQATMHAFAQELKRLPAVDRSVLVRQLEGLRDYSFCKSHAYSYAQLVWRLAWCKVYRPRAFWAAVMRHADSYYRRWVHAYEARLAGVTAEYKGAVPSIFATARRCRPAADPVAALRRGTVWQGTDFFPNCFVAPDGRFRGIIASVRVIGYGAVKTAVVCLGIAPKRYIEVLLRAKRLSLTNKIGVQGRGQLLEDGCYSCTSFTMF